MKDLGFDHWFEEHALGLAQEGYDLARISAVDRGSYLILNQTREVPAELSGRVSYQIEGSHEMPCVGDWVTVQYYNNDAAAIVHQVLPRKTFLRRKTPGNIDYQMIAANIDTAFIVQSCHFDFNENRLDRYLVMAADGHVKPVIVLTKIDLITEEELERKLAIIASITKARVIPISNITGTGFVELQHALTPGKTFCLLGSSGVGKTTIINRLIGKEAFATKAVSGTGEGTHTTTRRQLIVLDRGAMLIDTPGMRELGIIGFSEGGDTGFMEFASLSENCRFADCSHQHEPGCAVRAAIASGELPEGRYANYIKLKKESEYHEMSYLDKKKKEKTFGRFIKNVKKQSKR